MTFGLGTEQLEETSRKGRAERRRRAATGSNPT